MTRLPESRLSRRRALQAGSGLAVAAIAGQKFSIMSAFAQDSVEVTIWGNHPEWTEPMQEIIDAFQAANPGIENATDHAAWPGVLQLCSRLRSPVVSPPTSSASLKETIISKWIPAGGDLPFIDLTGRVDVSGLTDAARSQVEVDGKVYGTPLAAYTVGLATNNTVLAKLRRRCRQPHGTSSAPPARRSLRAAKPAWCSAARTGSIPSSCTPVLASSILGFEGLQKLRTGERGMTDPESLPAANLLVELQPFYNEGFEATDYAAAKAVFANGLGAMMVAGTADFTGYREVNPDADLGFVAWPGPAAGQEGHHHRVRASLRCQRVLIGREAGRRRHVRQLAGHGRSPATGFGQDRPSGQCEHHLSTDPIRQATVEAAAGGDVPVWYDLPELNGIVRLVQDNFGGLWSGA